MADEEDKKLQNELVALIEKHSGEDGTHSTPIPDLQLIRASKPSEPIHSVHEPALCLVAQGTKLVLLAHENYLYDPSSYLVVSLQLPVTGQVIEASPERPYLCLRLNVDPGRIFDLVSRNDPPIVKSSGSRRALYVNRVDRELLEAVVRLARLLDRPRDIPVLAPLVTQEILFRILQAEQGQSLAQFARVGSHAERIAKAVRAIERDYDKPLSIAELAAAVHMSPSSLHHRFKEITAMSPLQYQKQVRLQTARRLLLSEAVEAADAGFRVGYESPTQFSREYARMFGLPPIRDAKRLRESLGLAAD